MHPYPALVFPGPTNTTSYRKSCLVDYASQLPILLPTNPTLKELEKAAVADGQKLRESLQGKP
jgi:hypothetical protein